MTDATAPKELGYLTNDANYAKHHPLVLFIALPTYRASFRPDKLLGTVYLQA